MCRFFCYIAFMRWILSKISGFIATAIVLYILTLLAISISPDFFIYYFIVFSLAICLTTGILMIRKEKYKYFGKGIINGLISYYIFILFIYFIMSGPI